MNARISLQTEHGPLHGQLLLPPGARGLVVLAHAGTNPNTNPTAQQKTSDEELAALFHRAGLASLTLDLLTPQEDRFPDAHNNVPLHAKRLLDCLLLVKRQLLNDELTTLLTTLPIGLCASGPTSPVVVRVAALRDTDIVAVVCRGGLIDLAGTLYLHSLVAPILMLVGANDAHLVNSTRRALQEVSCRKELKVIPDSDSDFATTRAFEVMAHEAKQWFVQQFPPPAKIGSPELELGAPASRRLR